MPERRGRTRKERKEGVVQGARDCEKNLCARSPGNLQGCGEELRTVSSFLASTISPADKENFLDLPLGSDCREVSEDVGEDCKAPSGDF